MSPTPPITATPASPANLPKNASWPPLLRSRGRFMIETRREVGHRSIERRSSRRAQKETAMKYLSNFLEAIVLSGTKVDFIPVGQNGGPFEDIYQALVHQRFIVHKGSRTGQLRRYLANPAISMHPSKMQKLTILDPISKREGREPCFRYRRFPRSHMVDTELVPLSKFVQDCANDGVLKVSSIEGAMDVAKRHLNRWQMVGRRGLNMVFGYANFPQARTSSTANVQVLQPSLAVVLVESENQQLSPVNGHNETENGHQATATRQNSMINEIVADAHANLPLQTTPMPAVSDLLADDAYEVAQVHNPQASNVIQEPSKVDSNTQQDISRAKKLQAGAHQLIKLARNEHMFRNLKRALDPVYMAELGVVARVWVRQQGIDHETAVIPKDDSIESVEKKIYLFCLERIAARPRDSLLEKLQKELENLAMLLIHVRRSQKLPLFGNLGWPQCSEGNT